MNVESIGFSAGLLFGNQAQMGQRPEMDLEKAAEGLLSMKDADGDGYLSTDEVTLSEELFASADADGDGVLSSSEIADNMESIGEELRANGEMPPPPPPPSMTEDSDDLAAMTGLSSDLLSGLFSMIGEEE